jgi:hypothetical protein
MRDELFRTLAWKKGYGWYVTITLANGKTAKVSLDVADQDEAIPDVIRDRLRFLVENEPQITLKVAAAMTELYSDWNDGEIITPQQLAQRISLTDASIYEDGDGQLYYEPDDDMFAGHCICAYFDANGEIEEPALEG